MLLLVIQFQEVQKEGKARSLNQSIHLTEKPESSLEKLPSGKNEGIQEKASKTKVREADKIGSKLNNEFKIEKENEKVNGVRYSFSFHEKIRAIEEILDKSGILSQWENSEVTVNGIKNSPSIQSLPKNKREFINEFCDTMIEILDGNKILKTIKNGMNEKLSDEDVKSLIKVYENPTLTKLVRTLEELPQNEDYIEIPTNLKKDVLPLSSGKLALIKSLKKVTANKEIEKLFI